MNFGGESMKKFLSLVIAMTMMLTLTSLSMTSEAGTAGEYAAAITTESAVAPGQTITVTVTVGNVAKVTGGLSAVGMTLKYDAGAFGYVSGSANATEMPDKWTSSVNTEDAMFGEISLLASAGYGAVTYVEHNGDLVFTLKLTARSGAYPEPVLTTITCSTLGGVAVNPEYFNIITGDSIDAQLYLSQIVGDRPAAPRVMRVTDNAVYLMYDSPNIEYSYDLVNWQKDYAFENLAPNTYYFYARAAATGSTAAGQPSLPLKVVLGGTPGTHTEDPGQTTYTPPVQTTDDEPEDTVIEVESVTDTKITLTRNKNYEFSIDGRTWQDSNIFEGLTPKTTYHIFIRNKVTFDFDYLSVTTSKKPQTAPDAPEVESKTATSVTLKQVAGCEYSLDGKTWQQSNVFAGLKSRMIYEFYMRYSETDEYSASPESPKIYVLTDVLCDHAVTHTETVPSTCKTKGYEKVICDSCRKEISYEELPLAEHNGEWRSLDKPTCTQNGKEICVCSSCFEQIDERTIPATGHVVTEWKTTREATTTEEGEEVLYCVECEAVLERKTIPMIQPETSSTETTTTETTTTETTTTVETTTTETTATTETTPIDTTTLETTSTATFIPPVAPADDDDGISAGAVVLIVALVVIASAASAVAVLWVLSANMPRKKRARTKSRNDEE